MAYDVVLTIEAEADLDRFVWYLIFEKTNSALSKFCGGIYMR